MEKTFRIDPLGTMLHNKKTREIFSRVGNWKGSKFARWAIMRYAENEGYKSRDYRKKPQFLNDAQWAIYLACNEKSKIVDYAYYLAFHWLKSLPRFSYIRDGELLRLIIESGEDGVIDFLNSLEPEFPS